MRALHLFFCLQYLKKRLHSPPLERDRHTQLLLLLLVFFSMVHKGERQSVCVCVCDI